jgi:xanthine/uracil/vitamin C permease (AzgA family)
MLERVFGLRAHDTTVRRELLGGATTFATMAYIVVVNPAILGFAGIPRGPSTVATILTAVFGTLFMAFYANRPIAVAPYMGENAFIAFGLAALGVAWPQLLGAVFVSGLLFLAITLLGVRSWLAEAISPSLKHSFAASLFFIPVLEPLQKLQYAYAPALIAVGLLMIGSCVRIDFLDLTELVPAFVTITLMVFTYNIGNGLTAGLVVYPIVKAAAGRFREVKPGALVLAAVCAAYYVFGLPH